MPNKNNVLYDVFVENRFFVQISNLVLVTSSIIQ